MKTTFTRCIAGCVTTLALFMPALSQATVVDSADVNGLKTFTDTNTGRVWLDMNNFFNADSTSGTTGFAMISTAQSNGFSFATQSDVQSLLGTLSLGAGEWTSYASIMGYGIPRQLIWGMYDDSDGNPYGWAWAYSSDTSWNYSNDSTDANSVQNDFSTGSIDMGIWAYQTGNINNVPEPTALALIGLGLAGLAAMRRRKLV